MSSVFQNPNAAYLSSGPSTIPSPLNIGLENSRRFRALPVYAVLMAYGRDGMAEMFARQVRLARGISQFLDESPDYILLAQDQAPAEERSTGDHASISSGVRFGDTHIIVLFRAKEDEANAELVKRINGTRKMYVSGTKWSGQPACRVAVSTWKVDVQRDLKLVTDVLNQIVNGSS
jgi:glutamate/tyrosine decarboxylase-like PLP-dependent enzyme